MLIFFFSLFQITQLKIDHNPFAKGDYDTLTTMNDAKMNILVYVHGILLNTKL